MDSIEFILTRILEGESDLLNVWLQARNLYDLKQTITSEKVTYDGIDWKLLQQITLYFIFQ